jgi:uncharacterized phiE125 gp8 family phage protein
VRLVTYAAPALEPLELSTVQAHLRLTETSELGLLDLYAKAAREALERELGRQFISATYDGYLDAFPAGDTIELPMAPLVSVTSITYYDVNDTAATVTASDYDVDVASEPGRIVLAYGKTWPTTTLRPSNAVVVRYVAGYGTEPSNVPAPIRLALLHLTAHAFEHREPVLVGAVQSILPATYWDLVAGYRVAWGIA